ncbi:MAG: phosphoribosylamine--glycine ligase [Flaviaesturariibacter sp.]|nr:phosphoribosylamine--glycine ligase [Flaviaesturariibacter sp.]
MNILLLGAGCREHALAWKLSQSPRCTHLFIAPGNPGTAHCGTNLPIPATDFEAITNACRTHSVDMVVVGPEEPLVNGIVDHLHTQPGLESLLVIGPAKEAAQLEGSKAYAKAFMQRHSIPTAAYREFTASSLDEGIAYLRQCPLPIVLKADGLAAGKGVLICQSHNEAITELGAMLTEAKFGAAGQTVVVEEFLDGIELSVFALTDGRRWVLLPEAKDYKRIGEGDTGLNTGGMGAISPVPFADEAFMQKVITRIVAPTIAGLDAEGLEYTGFVFFGLIKVNGEPFVIEYNCRLGDPETEVVIPRIGNDLVDLLEAAALKKLDSLSIRTDPRAAATIMAVSGGYPGTFRKGMSITGLDAPLPAGSILFQAGTTSGADGIVTAGGRVLCMSSLAPTLREAVAQSRTALDLIRYDGMYFRKDIGWEFADDKP